MSRNQNSTERPTADSVHNCTRHCLSGLRRGAVNPQVSQQGKQHQNRPESIYSINKRVVHRLSIPIVQILTTVALGFSNLRDLDLIKTVAKGRGSCGCCKLGGAGAHARRQRRPPSRNPWIRRSRASTPAPRCTDLPSREWLGDVVLDCLINVLDRRQVAHTRAVSQKLRFHGFQLSFRHRRRVFSFFAGAGGTRKATRVGKFGSSSTQSRQGPQPQHREG